ncbi:lysophospholipid acyltransferase family protein [soil metagenome]
METGTRASVPLTLYTYAEFLSLAVGFLPILAASSLRNRGDVTQRSPGRWMRRFGRTSSYLSPVWDFSWDGTPPSDIEKSAYVVVCNHESNADPFLISHLPWDMRWIAKEEIFKMPLLGWLMHASGDIKLKRGDKGSVGDMFDACLETLRAGMSVMMFPEGTRSKTGDLLPFKDGAFDLAIRAQVPVLPLALSGTRDCMRTGAMALGRARAKVRVLDPIPTKGLTKADLPALRDRARDVISANVKTLREELTR